MLENEFKKKKEKKIRECSSNRDYVKTKNVVCVLGIRTYTHVCDEVQIVQTNVINSWPKVYYFHQPNSKLNAD